MTKARRRPNLVPRVVSAAEAAGYIGKSSTWFSNHRAELEAHGFPKILPIVEGYDLGAVDKWLDSYGGTPGEMTNFDQAWMRASNE